MIPTAGQHWPINCTGYGECKQGRRPCRTPLTCSGLDADEAIEQFRLRRQPLPATPPPAPEPDEGPGLFCSPAFWIDGALCLLVWFALYLVVTR